MASQAHWHHGPSAGVTPDGYEKRCQTAHHTGERPYVAAAGARQEKNGGLCSWLRDGVGGWCERWITAGLNDQALTGIDGVHSAQVRSVNACSLRPAARPHSPSECNQPPPPGEGRVATRSEEKAGKFLGLHRLHRVSVEKSVKTQTVARSEECQSK